MKVELDFVVAVERQGSASPLLVDETEPAKLVGLLLLDPEVTVAFPYEEVEVEEASVLVGRDDKPEEYAEDVG